MSGRPSVDPVELHLPDELPELSPRAALALLDLLEALDAVDLDDVPDLGAIREAS